MQTLTNLNNVITLLQQNAAKIGITVAGLLVAVYAVSIMLNNDQSPAARTERWAQLKRVFICAVIIAATGTFVQFATGLGGMI
jgi:hypothetical protein